MCNRNVASSYYNVSECVQIFNTCFLDTIHSNNTKGMHKPQRQMTKEKSSRVLSILFDFLSMHSGGTK